MSHSATEALQALVHETQVSNNFIVQMIELSKPEKETEAEMITYYSKFFKLVIENIDECAQYQFWQSMRSNIQSKIESWQTNYRNFNDARVKQTNKDVETILAKL